jgi:hypothetical protein
VATTYAERRAWSDSVRIADVRTEASEAAVRDLLKFCCAKAIAMVHPPLRSMQITCRLPAFASLVELAHSVSTCFGIEFL